ncbi:MAG TPA: DUF998 domain-containing protein [Anaerolineales bacterium]|nr:DUF998 domain-containing protein [Anaerolineales bacterium]
MTDRKRVQLAVLAGMVGPLILGSVIAILTFVQRDFMTSIGWRLEAPLDWPSGLALGPYGWIMTLTFLLCGILIVIFASGLGLSLPRIKMAAISIWLLVLAGVGMIGLVSPTDKTIRTTPRTWHGILHDSSFAVIGLTLMPAMILLGLVFRRDARWKDLAIYTWVTVALAIPTFWMKGFAFYIFLFAILVWCEVIAFRLKATMQNTGPED